MAGSVGAMSVRKGYERGGLLCASLGQTSVAASLLLALSNF